MKIIHFKLGYEVPYHIHMSTKLAKYPSFCMADNNLNNNIKYIEVAVALPVQNTYTYSVSIELLTSLSPGKRVLVPFRNRQVTGYILGQCERKIKKKIKQILSIIDDEPMFPESLIPFFRWIADYYMHPIGEVIKSALPGGLNDNEYGVLSITRNGQLAAKGMHGNILERKILNIIDEKPCSFNQLPGVLKKEISNATIQSMIKKKWIEKKRIIKRGKIRPHTVNFVSMKEPYPREDKLTEKRKRTMRILKSHGEMTVKELKTKADVSYSVIFGLKETGYVSIIPQTMYRDPLGEPIEPDEPPSLTSDQRKVVTHVLDYLGKGFHTFLLAGVTGSGKTEVYMQLAAEVIKQGKPVLVLVPEIALISQMERRFRARFGEHVAILHSQLSKGERYDQWLKILRKEVKIAIGARSAVFAPFSKTGIIIIDEEHDSSYKQEGNFRYNARDLAVVRAKFDDGLSLLGSATPSVQSYYNTLTHKYVELNLNKRVEQRPMPRIEIVDLRNYRDFRGKKRFITKELYQGMSDVLNRGEQVLLFLNRRGFAGFPVCAACGESMKCINCDITLTLHQKSNAYKCHYCGFSKASVAVCSNCGSSSIKNLGIGTEKLEAAVQSYFPNANIARMDRDTTRRKGSIIRLLKDLRANQIDVLVGTQMVTKGHDFPNITLVGIICADLSLNFPDFRAGERTFQLLAQVAGRAGRGRVPGRVILQTYNPEHFSIKAAKEQDFKGFYKREIEFRNSLNYPPFSRMIQLKVSGPDKVKTREHAHKLGKSCFNLLEKDIEYKKAIEILGPIEAAIMKIARKYRFQLLLKGMNVNQLQSFSHRLMNENPSLYNHNNIKVAVDVDPLFMM